MIKCPRMIFSGVANKLCYLPFLFFVAKTNMASEYNRSPAKPVGCVSMYNKKEIYQEPLEICCGN